MMCKGYPADERNLKMGWCGETRIPDPIEIMESKVSRLEDKFVDEYTCMECGKKYDYEMNCPDPLGMGPAVCNDCLGFDPFEMIAERDKNLHPK